MSETNQDPEQVVLRPRPTSSTAMQHQAQYGSEAAFSWVVSTLGHTFVYTQQATPAPDEPEDHVSQQSSVWERRKTVHRRPGASTVQLNQKQMHNIKAVGGVG